MFKAYGLRKFIISSIVLRLSYCLFTGINDGVGDKIGEGKIFSSFGENITETSRFSGDGEIIFPGFK